MRFFCFLLILTYGFCAKAQQPFDKNKTISQFDTLLNKVPREKLYFHLDKSVYAPTDTIWFKGYLVNASYLNFSPVSGLVYTEMINSSGEVIQILSLPTVMGLTWGSFVVDPDKYKPDTYTFRAYTNWMQNFDEASFFKKEIKVLGFTQVVSTASPLKVKAPKINKSDSTLKEQLKNIDVQFLPEGGNWLADRKQVIAFKAINAAGKGIKISGEVIDSKNNKISSFTSNDKGMGYFTLVAQNDETYTANISYGKLNKTQALPKVQQTGTTLQVVNDYASDSLKITTTSNTIGQEVMMIGQSRGILCFLANVKFNLKTKIVKIAKDIFPTGVCQILILDEKKRIVNERNFFINHQDQLQLSVNSSSLSYGLRDSIALQIKALNSQKKPSIASFSIAVTDDGQVEKDLINDNNILTYLLLTADLKGEVENPGSYFYQIDKEKYEDLDALMLTQGWVSYDWDLNKKMPFKAEKEYVIHGRVSSLMNKAVPNAKITLFGRNKTLLLIDTVTNNNGEFTFKKLPAMDSASFVIQALNTKGKKGSLGITVDEFRPALVPIPKNTPILAVEPLDSVAQNFVATKKESYKAQVGDGILLNEIKIVGKRAIPASKNLNGPGEADQIITDEALSRIGKKTLLDILQEKVKGFRVGYRRKTNITDIYLNWKFAKVIIDGVELDFFYTPPDGTAPLDDYFQFLKTYLDYYLAEDIKGIEIMDKAKYSSAYRSRFINPMDEEEYAFIEVTTKTGAGPFLKKSANMYVYRPINYGDVKQFYSPKYTLANKSSKQPDLRSTIYWNPNLLTNEKGEAQVSFFSADKKGTYTVWIEGSDTQGGFGLQTLKLTIK